MTKRSTEAIKTMKLYTHVERVERELRANGQSSGLLDPKDLASMDQLHYGGTAVVDEAIDRLGLGPDHQVLDVGAGLGGPARHIASKVGCSITAIELQPDLHDLGESLTKRCQLAEHITHQCGDVLTTPLPSKKFDALVSWLTVLHIPNRDALFDRCATALKHDGGMFIEDFYAKKPLSKAEQASLEEDVFCPYLPDRQNYQDQLSKAGFVGIDTLDLTDEWVAFVQDRLMAFRENSTAFIDRHGADTFHALDHFYDAIATLFLGGSIGGLRIQASADHSSGTA